MNTQQSSGDNAIVGGKFSSNAQPRKPANFDNTKKFQPKQYKKIFTEYVSDEEANAGLLDKTMFKGSIRINPKNYQECFLDNPKGTIFPDVLCAGQDRNRAMHGDIVLVKYKNRLDFLINFGEYLKWWKSSPKGDQGRKPAKKDEKRTLKQEIDEYKIDSDSVPDNCLIPTGSVVRIEEKRHHRVAAGKLQLMTNNAYNVLFVSSDSRIPRIMIPRSDVDPEFFNRPADFERFLYTAKMTDWRTESIYADGRLVKLLGESGTIGPETDKIIFENQIDNRDFSDGCLASLPITEASEWKIPEEEFKYRRDFRNDMVFTIDPKTARDLDDALSINHIDDCDGKGTPGFEIGIHIADVTYFVKDLTELDKWAEQRGNSTYLAQMVIPMLPRILCEQLCSLNPGVDRLSFSTVVKVNYEAEIKDVWFGRTIIRSRVKLAYEHAQDFIENPEKDFAPEELPEISDGVLPYEIKEKVLMLHRVAQIMRARREENGALRIEQPRLKFSVDPETKQPIGVSVYEIRDSNKLVEEFMLLANMEVAKKIEKEFPEHAFLRNHPPPKEKKMKEAAELCAKIGFTLDGNSSSLLANSFKKYNQNSKLHMCIRQVISSITIKPMQQAKYFCVSGQDYYRHFALNVERYTHFTSPIRRYPDMIVHRQLAASLGYCSPPSQNAEELQQIANHCNETKLASKTASEASSELYFGVFVHASGKFQSQAVVIGVMDKAFDVIIVNYGVVKRVYCDKLKASIKQYDENGDKLVLEWLEDPEAEPGNREKFESTIQICTVVDVEIYPLKEVDVGAVILRPTLLQRGKYSKTLRQMFDEGDNTLE
ncbi:unnamed protein product [Caenorhabditis angaria]|uniref:DIS3-like exonuclease 2 n=1 Tax=Caenorhabditis angaria TaxID=860376 RepID=A0A9P1IIY2_9PELO|nr:unnamed protein product [Caenorhabditis angaria]